MTTYQPDPEGRYQRCGPAALPPRPLPRVPGDLAAAGWPAGDAAHRQPRPAPVQAHRPDQGTWHFRTG